MIAVARHDEQAVALTEDLGAQLGRMKGAGAKILELLSMVALDRDAPPRDPVAFARVRRVVEDELDGRLRDVFSDFDEQPFAVASLGQVHRARTVDGDDVAVKVQRADAIEADLRGIGVVAPLIGRLAPAVDAHALLAEVRERIADELDYEVEAQHQRRLERRFRGHPHVRVPRVHTELCTQRVLVTEHVAGLGAQEVADLPAAERDRVGEIAFRFYFGLAWRDGVVAGDPHPDNLLLCDDGRVCLLDFGLLRDLDADYLEGERAVMHAIAEGDAQSVHDVLSALGYLPEPDAFDPAELIAHLAAAGEWLLARGSRQIDPDYVAGVIELGYPPRSPWFGLMRRERMPPPTLLLRRMEVQVLSLLGALRAAGDWGAIAAEHHAGEPASSPLGREDGAFFERRP